MAETIILISHPCRAWPGARDLKTARDGWLLAISRGDLLRDAAKRLLEEGFDPASSLVIRDDHDSSPELRAASLAEATKL
jgi:hypothetical protein